jgi:hypothetical protein
MGMYDTVIVKNLKGEDLEIQFKHGEQALINYKIGDYIPVSDGLHFAPEGCFVVYQGYLVAAFDSADQILYEKWGGLLDYPNLTSPIEAHLKQLIQSDNIDETHTQQEESMKHIVAMAKNFQEPLNHDTLFRAGQKCDCCGEETMYTHRIEHDSNDPHKAAYVCQKCHTKIYKVWTMEFPHKTTKV